MTGEKDAVHGRLAVLRVVEAMAAQVGCVMEQTMEKMAAQSGCVTEQTMEKMPIGRLGRLCHRANNGDDCCSIRMCHRANNGDTCFSGRMCHGANNYSIAEI